MDMTLIAVLTLSALGANAASRPASPKRSLESMLDDVRGSVLFDVPCVPGDKHEFVLRLDQARRLHFSENEAGLTEVLFRYEPDCLHVLYGYASEPHAWATATPARPVEWRITRSDGAKSWMHCTTELLVLHGNAHVTFLAKPMSSAEVDEARRRDTAQKLQRLRRTLEWDEAGGTVEPIRIMIPDPDDPDLVTLRHKYDLQKVVAGPGDDYDQLARLAKWVHDRWSHSGDNTPSRSDPLTILAEAQQGKRFRCVEYSIVVAACAQALGMPARTLGLKTKDVETAKSGAGHVVSEVWLQSRRKWVFVDGQMDAIPEKDGLPLNAVEFQAAFARNEPGLKIRSSSKTDAASYIAWVAPYLYYFDFNIDQRFFGDRSDHADNRRVQPQRGKIMLVPKGAKQPIVFQRKQPIRNCTYISNPTAFYPTPTSPK
jgi:hypothetical protein